MLNDGTQWKFNPLGAPYCGGKWEAAVESVKFHLKRTSGDTLLTFEKLSTPLSQIEAVLNSRPLEPLSEDPDDLTTLTPGHFLVGEAQTTDPEPSLDEGNLSKTLPVAAYLAKAAELLETLVVGLSPLTTVHFEMASSVVGN